jgi:hypothetical protein
MIGFLITNSACRPNFLNVQDTGAEVKFGIWIVFVLLKEKACKIGLKQGSEMAGEKLDLNSDPQLPPAPKGANRRFVGIHFACCDVYIRIYVNPGETAYVGRCPKCCRKVKIRIGPGGTTSRFFTAY